MENIQTVAVNRGSENEKKKRRFWERIRDKVEIRARKKHIERTWNSRTGELWSSPRAMTIWVPTFAGTKCEVVALGVQNSA